MPNKAQEDDYNYSDTDTSYDTNVDNSDDTDDY